MNNRKFRGQSGNIVFDVLFDHAMWGVIIWELKDPITINIDALKCSTLSFKSCMEKVYIWVKSQK